jgi:hypothetical protein
MLEKMTHPVNMPAEKTSAQEDAYAAINAHSLGRLTDAS